MFGRSWERREARLRRQEARQLRTFRRREARQLRREARQLRKAWRQEAGLLRKDRRQKARRWALRMLGGVLVAVGVVLAVGVVWVLGPGAAWWLEHVDGVPVDGENGLKGKELTEALGTVRGHAMALGTGLLATVAIYYTATNAASARRSADAAQETTRLGEQGLVTGRYTAAIEQLGSDKPDIRLGGIYALERIARDSPRDHPTVTAVLAAYVREHSHDPDAYTGNSPDDTQEHTSAPRSRFRPDLHAALTVLNRRNLDHDTDRLNLTGADLTRADLTRADLTRADLTRANLTDTNLTRADLGGADLTRANLTRADLTRANLTGANLTRANLTRANLTDTNLTRADLGGADLGGANLTGVSWSAETRWPVGTADRFRAWSREVEDGRWQVFPPDGEIRVVMGPAGPPAD